MDPKAIHNPNSNMPYPAEKTDEQRWTLNQVSLIILAGGKSLRMGMNKAHLNWHDSRFIDVLVEKGKSLGFGEILLSGLAERVHGCRNVPDLLKGRGPLGGLYSSLESATFNHTFVVPVDCPGISKETIIGMAEMHLSQKNEITLLKHGERLEPLIGMYETAFRHKILPVIEFEGAPVFRALDKANMIPYHMKENEVVVMNFNTREAYLAWVEQNENSERNLHLAGD